MLTVYSHYPLSRTSKDAEGQMEGVMGSVELLNSKVLSTQPIVGIDWRLVLRYLCINIYEHVHLALIEKDYAHWHAWIKLFESILYPKQINIKTRHDKQKEIYKHFILQQDPLDLWMLRS